MLIIIPILHPLLDLPRNYLYQMIAMEFKTPAIIKPVSINENVNLEPEDRARLFQAHSSFLKFIQFVDKIPINEQQRRDQKNMIKDKVGRRLFFTCLILVGVSGNTDRLIWY